MVETIDHLTSNLSDNTELYDMSKADADFAGLLAIEAETGWPVVDWPAADVRG